MDVNGNMWNPWNAGVIKHMHKQCVPGAFLPLTRLVLFLVQKSHYFKNFVPLCGLD